MAKKPQAKSVGEKVRVTVLKEIRLDEFALVLRPGDNLMLAQSILEDPRVVGNFEPKE